MYGTYSKPGTMAPSYPNPLWYLGWAVALNAAKEASGRLRVDVPSRIARRLLAPALPAYLAQHPQMRVDAEITGRLVDVVHEGFDLAIRVGTLPDSTLTARRLGTLTYALFAAPGYLKLRGTPRSPDDLAQHELLVFTPARGASAWSLIRQGQTHRIPLRQARIRASSSFAVRDAAAAGLGIALLPHLIADPLVADGTLRPVLEGWSSPDMPVNAVFANKIAAIEDEGERLAFIQEQRRLYEEDVDLLRLASELVIDGIVEWGSLRTEVHRRLVRAAGKSRHFSSRRHGVPPV